MKIIDLLNKIANGEEVPKKIKFDNKEYENEPCYMLYEATGDRSELQFKKFLNDEIEIIEEEEKKIPEKLENLYKIEKGLTLDGVIAWQGANNKILGTKIDEIIDYLNSKGE